MSHVERVRHCYELAAQVLLAEATANGMWQGELSSSALSTATAITALEFVRRARPDNSNEFERLIEGGLQWLYSHQNPDGGWGDTVLSHSNISTTTLAYASFLVATSSQCSNCRKPTHQPITSRASSNDNYSKTIADAKAYIDRHGGFDAIRKRYGKDHTFSVPILTQCALAGLVPWRQIPSLPFELGWLPHWFYRWIRLPVVSYALPALIAIGQVRHHFAPSRNPLLRILRNLAIKPTLVRLTSVQPESGGFLEATPLTSFVTMSLAAMGRIDHPVTRRGVTFLIESVRPDGSWPIDTNLATWVTTLSVNALLHESIPDTQAHSITSWLLSQQHREVHRYTNAEPGGWAWTDLSGGVPDADDTPGAILTLLKLDSKCPELPTAIILAVEWLLNLQNRDGGWPTFCRGWGALPFDRSSPDLTAHALRALHAWLNTKGAREFRNQNSNFGLIRRIENAVEQGFRFLARTQRSDGTWLPLWFGNQFSPDDENPVYGVSKALAAYRQWNRLSDPPARRAMEWLASVQNADGGWGGAPSAPSSIEETALAVEILISTPSFEGTSRAGLDWLIDKVESDGFRNPAPIGLYFAKLWYFERLYPIIFTVAALARVVENAKGDRESHLQMNGFDHLQPTPIETITRPDT